MTLSSLQKQKQIKNSLLYFFSIGLSILIPFITMPIYTRILNPEDYGLLALVMIYAIIISGLANFGITNIYERNFFEYKNDKDKFSQLFYSCFCFTLMNFSILFVITLSFNEYISNIFTSSNNNGNLILLAITSNFFQNIGNYFFLTYYKNSENAYLFTKYQLIKTILNLIFSFYFIVFLRFGIHGLLLGQLLSTLLLFFYLLLKFLNILKFSLNFKILIDAIKISYPLVPGGIFKIINSQFDKYMINFITNVSNVGIYHIGKNISEIVFTFMTAIENVFNPHIYKMIFDNHDNRAKAIGIYLTPFFYISTSITLILALLSEELLYVLTPENYHNATSIISILSLYYSILFFGKITSMQFLYTKKTYLTSLLTIFSVFLNILLNIPFIIYYGVLGAAIATLLSGLISTYFAVRYAHKCFKIYYEWSKILLMMFNLYISVSAIFLLNYYDLSYIMILTFKVLSLFVHLYLGIYFNIITMNNISLIKSLFFNKTAVGK